MGLAGWHRAGSAIGHLGAHGAPARGLGWRPRGRAKQVPSRRVVLLDGVERIEKIVDSLLVLVVLSNRDASEEQRVGRRAPLLYLDAENGVSYTSSVTGETQAVVYCSTAGQAVASSVDNAPSARTIREVRALEAKVEASLSR